MKTKNILYLFLLVYCTNAFAQGGAYIYPSKDGNLVRVLLPRDTDILKNTAYFKFTRSELRLNNIFSKETNIGQTKRANSVAELRSIVGSAGIESLKKIKGYISDAQIQIFLDKEYNYDSLALLSMFSEKYLIATGLGYQDRETEKDIVYRYKVFRVDINGSEEFWGETKIVSNVPNPLLSQIKVEKDSVITGDSLVLFRFHVEFPKSSDSTDKNFPFFAPLNYRASAKEQRKMAKEQNQPFIELLNKKPIMPQFTYFNVYYQINSDPWQLLIKLTIAPDKDGNFKFDAFIETLPESLVSVRILPETYGNEHPNADYTMIHSAYAIAQNSVPLIYAVYGKDSTDCIKINWEALPKKPYIKGISIEKVHQNSTVVLGAISPSATSYTDYDIEPGGNYTYLVKVLFDEKQNVKQEVGSSITLACTTFSPPLPPFNLSIDTNSRAIPILKWQASPSKSRFGFIVYKGLSPTSLSHLGEVVKDTSFTDSTGVFYAKSKYYYAVVTQNLSQDTSDFSNIVEFRPILPIEIAPPPFLNFKFVNGDVIFDWIEMREKDSFIGGYVLERRGLEDSVYTRVHPSFLTINYFKDTTHIRGEIYDYRIASATDDGQIGDYSMPHEVFFPHPTPSALTNFDLNNFEKGVQVKWPAAQTGTTKNFVIYRNNPPIAKLSKLTEVPAGQFEYIDRTVAKEGSYIYAMSKIDKNGIESPKTHRKSIKRKMPNKIKP